MGDLMAWIQAQWGLSPEIQRRILISLLTVIGLWLIRRWLLRLGLRQTTDIRVQYQWQKTSSYIFWALVVLFVGPLWLNDLTNLATYLGLLSAGLAIALRDPVTNLVGWAFILWRRPFIVGDRIQIGDTAGDVVDLRLFQFSLMEIGNWVDADQSTGRIIHIPNGKVFTEKLANYTQSFEYIWNEIPVLVTFESDWRKAKGILEGIITRHAAGLGEGAEAQVRQAARRYLVYFSNLTPIVYTTVEASGVLLTIRYFCPPRQRRDSAQSVWEAILEAFAQHKDIEFAYPTTRFYQARFEGAS